MPSDLRPRRRICGVSELPAGQAVTFTGLVRGEERPCFVLQVPGSASQTVEFASFLNVCAHRNQPVVVNDRPFDEDLLVECRAHGAHYDPRTGLCVRGPCVGARLVEVTVEQVGEDLYAVDDDTVDDSIYEE